MNNYKTENLYVGLLGIVSEIEDDKIKITSIDKYIIFTKESFSPSFNIYTHTYDKIAKDIFTNKEYFFFNNNFHPERTIAQAIGGCAILNSFPIENYFDYPKNKVSKKELLVILNNLNSPFKEVEKKEEPVEPITDSILKTILETSDLVNVSNIDEELKQSLIKELESLAENYIIDIENFNSKDEINPFESEYKIRMIYIKKLVELEQKVNDPKTIKVYSLKKQFNQFKKEINSTE